MSSTHSNPTAIAYGASPTATVAASILYPPTYPANVPTARDPTKHKWQEHSTWDQECANMVDAWTIDRLPWSGPAWTQEESESTGDHLWYRNQWYNSSCYENTVSSTSKSSVRKPWWEPFLAKSTSEEASTWASCKLVDPDNAAMQEAATLAHAE